MNKINRDAFYLKWSTFGLYFFLLFFLFASGVSPLRTVFYIFLLLPFLLVIVGRKWRMEEYGGQYTLAALVFAAYCVLSSLWGNTADFFAYLKYWFFLAFWLCGVSWVFYSSFINMQKLYATLIFAGSVMAIITIGYFYGYRHNALSVRLSGLGLLENSTVVAQTFGVIVLLAYVSSLQALTKKGSLFLFVAALICMLPVAMSQSRGAALGLIVMLVSALVIIKPSPSVWVAHICIALLGGVFLVVFTNVDQILLHRGASFSFRDVIWRELLTRVVEHPFFGLGSERNARIIIPDVDVFHHAHNSWIDILYYTGLIGLFLAFWHLVLLLGSYSRSKIILPVYLWLVYGCLCLFTNGSNFFAAPDAQWWMYWVPASLLAALVKSRRYVQ